MSNQIIQITALIMTMIMKIVQTTQLEEIGVMSEKETTSMTAIVIQIVAHMVVATPETTTTVGEFAGVAFRVVRTRRGLGNRMNGKLISGRFKTKTHFRSFYGKMEQLI
jgi:hypothetical protein